MTAYSPQVTNAIVMSGSQFLQLKTVEFHNEA